MKYILFISDSGLTLSSTEAIAFGEFAELRCTENDTVTNDGFVTKLKCLTNGKFQTRKWNDNKCRERKICSKSPPRPPADFGLARNYSRDVKEFGYAEYNCISSHQVKLIYSEKATKFCKIFPLLLTSVHTVKSKGKICKILWPSQNI